MILRFVLSIILLISASANITYAQTKLKISGIYPHLAHTNDEREVGIGAVVPWAGSL